jgi:serine/threonine-protein kinase RIO1
MTEEHKRLSVADDQVLRNLEAKREEAYLEQKKFLDEIRQKEEETRTLWAKKELAHLNWCKACEAIESFKLKLFER